MTVTDPNLGARWKHLAFILRGEQRVEQQALLALLALGDYAAALLPDVNHDVTRLDNRAPVWRQSLETGVVPAVEDIFTASWDATARGAVDVTPYATRHIESVWSRLVRAADTTFDDIRLSVEAGRSVGESIPQITARINKDLLRNGDYWKGRARTIARTEVIGANNAGARGAARATADYLGIPHGAVARSWLSTHDARTRPSHMEADGQLIYGMDAHYTVGGAFLEGPGDPSGPAGEVINCRCTETFSYPGDPDYPGDAPAVTDTAPTVTGPTVDGETLRDTLDPTRKRTQGAIRKQLEATREGRDLTASIKAFTETRGGVANLRKNITKTVDGTASQAVQDRTRTFVNSMNSYPTDAVPELWRGIAVKVEENTNAWWDKFEGTLQPGQRFDLNASSFSSSERKAAEFERMIGGTRKASSDHTAVRFQLEGQAHALPVEQLSKFKSEKEWITGGEFEVVSYSPATKSQPYYLVTIRQVKSLEVS